MKVLLSYATSEGQTHKIVERAASLIRDRGASASLYDAASLIDVPDVAAFDAVILAGSVHEHVHQESIVNFATAHAHQLAAKPSALISVSLSAATPDGRAEAQAYVDRFIAETGWQPGATLLLGGAMNLADCDYFQRQVLADILEKCPAIEADDKNYVFTDWQALADFLAGFMAAAEK